MRAKACRLKQLAPWDLLGLQLPLFCGHAGQQRWHWQVGGIAASSTLPKQGSPLQQAPEPQHMPGAILPQLMQAEGLLQLG